MADVVGASVSVKKIGAHGTMRVLVADASRDGTAPVLLFLHGKGEASRYENELPKVLFHLSPPFRAMTGELSSVTVVVPQAPNDPEDMWNWRDYVAVVGQFVKSAYPGRRIVAAGFSRGGLGVLQLMAAYPGLVSRWALVDPQRAEDSRERQAVAPGLSDRPNGWLRYGKQLAKNTPFSEYVASILPATHSRFIDLSHAELAQRAFAGDPLEGSMNLYTSLGLTFRGVSGA